MNKCCQKCGARRCGKYHLYVIELDFELTKNKRFMRKNPHYKKGNDCLYVGSTSHTCECRFKQHQLHAKKQTDGFFCSCDKQEKFREFVRAGGHVRGSYYPGVYGLRLRPDLFSKYNPIPTQRRAFFLEDQLAQLLRSQGYAVWQH